MDIPHGRVNLFLLRHLTHAVKRFLLQVTYAPLPKISWISFCGSVEEAYERRSGYGGWGCT
jgi:hypothetical protein